MVGVKGDAQMYRRSAAPATPSVTDFDTFVLQRRSDQLALKVRLFGGPGSQLEAMLLPDTLCP